MSDTDYRSAWIPDGAPSRALMVVPLPQGPERLDMCRYLNLLSLRLSDLLEAQDDPEQAAIDVVRELERAGLAQSENVRTHNPMACAMDLIEDNPNFRTWLSLQGVMPGGTVSESSGNAARNDAGGLPRVHSDAVDGVVAPPAAAPRP